MRAKDAACCLPSFVLSAIKVSSILGHGPLDIVTVQVTFKQYIINRHTHMGPSRLHLHLHITPVHILRVGGVCAFKLGITGLKVKGV